MFGVDDALIWGPLLGAAMGGLASKKNPLKGALLGGALGAGGGLLAGPGGLMGAAATPATTGITGVTAAGSLGVNPLLGAASGGTGLGGVASGGVGLGSSAMPSLVSPSMLATASGTPEQILAANPSMFESAMSYAKPIGNIASSANSVKSLLSPDGQMPQLQPAPVVTGQGGAQSLASLVSSNANTGDKIAMDREQRAKRRRQLIGG